MKRHSLKLNHQAAKLYCIINMKKHSYVVNLSKHMQINNIFHTDYLRKASDDSLSEQIQKSDSLTEVNNQSEYEVDRVLTS